MTNPIRKIHLSHIKQPLSLGFADAKVATGKQSALTAVDLLFVEIETDSEHVGLGFAYTLRAGGTAFLALAEELAPMLIGEDAEQIEALWQKLAWRTNSLGVGGLAYQVIAAFDSALWDLKAKGTGLPLAKLWGCYREGVRVYNSGGQYLQASIPEMQAAAKASVERGIGGIKMKVGQPDWRTDIERIEAMLEVTGRDIPLMIDANQQWSRSEALQFCRKVDQMGLYFIEEPLEARDYEGHGMLSSRLDTPIASGEMLTSYDEVSAMVKAKGVGVLQADAPRMGGLTPFRRVLALAEAEKLILAPHFVMEQHLHVTAAFPGAAWVEHFDWFEPLFNERMDIHDGRIWLSEKPGLGLSLTDKARELTVRQATVEASA